MDDTRRHGVLAGMHASRLPDAISSTYLIIPHLYLLAGYPRLYPCHCLESAIM